MAKTSFQRRLESRVKETVDKRSTQVAFGGCSDYSQYRESVGYLQAMQEVLKICEEIEAESN